MSNLIDINRRYRNRGFKVITVATYYDKLGQVRAYVAKQPSYLFR